MNIVIVDNNNALRDALCKIPTENETINVMAALSEGQELLDYLHNNVQPDFVFVNADCQNPLTLEAVREAVRQHRDLKIVCVSLANNKDNLLEMIAAGACHSLTKNDIDKNQVKNKLLSKKK